MTVATRDDCHVCVAMHTAKLTSPDAYPALIAALRSPGSPALPDERLDAVRRFTLEVIASAGAVDDAALRDFLAYGYSERTPSTWCSASGRTPCRPWPTGSREPRWTPSTAAHA
ncbi:hypothetical protein SCALM49S_01891 [Streptomyces californicus]